MAWNGSRKYSSKLLFGLIALSFGVVLFVWILSQQGDSFSNQSIQYPDHELTGSEEEVEEEFIQLTEDDGSFIYMFESGCEQCQQMSEIFLPLAEHMDDISITALNIDRYPIASEFVEVDEFPYITYFNDGWEIAYMEGEHPEEHYEEFFEHFQLGHDHDH